MPPSFGQLSTIGQLSKLCNLLMLNDTNLPEDCLLQSQITEFPMFVLGVNLTMSLVKSNDVMCVQCIFSSTGLRT